MPSGESLQVHVYGSNASRSSSLGLKDEDSQLRLLHVQLLYIFSIYPRKGGVLSNLVI